MYIDIFVFPILSLSLSRSLFPFLLKSQTNPERSLKRTPEVSTPYGYNGGFNN